MRNYIDSKWPLLAAQLIFLLTIAAVVLSSMAGIDDVFVYPLDDTYIHMSMAKNMAEHGVWGFTRYEFSSTTSSPFWTFIIAAAYYAISINEVTPIVITVAFGLMTIWYCDKLIRQFFPSKATFIVLLGLILITPMVPLSILAMEHILHVFVTIVFVCISARIVSNDENKNDRLYMLLLALILPMVRLESSFTVLIVFFLLVKNQQYKLGLYLGIFSGLPLISYGVLSYFQDWYVLPNSIILKGSSLDASTLSSTIDSLGRTAITTLLQTKHLLLLVIGAIIVAYDTSKKLDSKSIQHRLVATIFILTTFLHLQFSSTGWLYRYEAYLVALGYISVLPLMLIVYNKILSTLKDARTTPVDFIIASCLIFGLILYPFISRSINSVVKTQMAMSDRYYEHLQPTMFVAEYYSDSVVVINDIGIMAYYSSSIFLDMFGLGSIEPVRFRREVSGYTKEDVLGWTSDMDAEIAILQVEWEKISIRIPDEWIKVCEWEVPRNVVFGDKRVAFFATNSENAAILKNRILEYSESIPKEIKLTIF